MSSLPSSSSKPPSMKRSSNLQQQEDGAAAEALTARQQAIVARLQEIALPSSFKPAQSKKRVKLSDYTAATAATIATTTALVPVVVEKTDTHWDYLLKEMQWLAADFTSERKRHRATSRKVAVAVQNYAASAAQRRWRQLQEAEVQRRKRAARLGRAVLKQFWRKLEQVVTYQQKQSLEEERKKAMNQQLVRLVQQTEQYTVTVQQDASDMVKIEEALHHAALQSTTQRPRARVSDYARLWRQQTLKQDAAVIWYGASTEESGSDATFSLEGGEASSDDESTLRAAEQEEAAERRTTQFTVDPVELQLLQNEAEMDVQQVLERLAMEEEKEKSGTTAAPNTNTATKRVQFAVDAGSDADDDMDASDVEDFVSANDEEEEDDDAEFEPSEADAIDDETTIEAEEKLGRDISHEEEIAMLHRENEMSLEELRAMFAGMVEAENGVASVNDDATAEVVADGADKVTDGEAAANTNVADEGTEAVAASDSKAVDAKTSDETVIPASDLDKVTEGAEEDSASAVDEDETSAADDVSSATGSEEFEPDENVVDDETTIEAEERLGREMSAEEEIAMLNRENELSVDELRAMYSGMMKDEKEKCSDDSAAMDADDGVDSDSESRQPSELLGLLGEVEDQENDDDFRPDPCAVDDETTIEAEERLGREMSAEEEIALLKRENEMSVDELRALYQQHVCDDAEPAEELSDVRSKRAREEAKPFSDPDEDREVGSSNKKPKAEVSNTKHEEVDIGKASLDKLEASDELARKLRVSRPFLIPTWVKLREYQQIGLNWLVSLQSRRLNGILADEMGLGKTLQTISLLAYLAAYKGIWGPHLIVVPTSVILNWETEMKRFCPALKVLCYYGSAKRRKELRQGWTKSNWHHVVITSYQLAVQDSFAFKRKRWYYLVLDEAQHIKNFQSQRWQTLINFNTQRRLLLTGTPLQNNLMELWSLMHFLMPYIFRSRKEFSYWFANPLTSMIEGTSNQNDDVVRRLHGIIRPFVLRRLKKDVETQLPGKFEHILKCQLSRRQMFIYEEFMARSSTRQALRKGGNFMGMMNVLMQLRKVCNHPDLFEPRSIVTPFFVDLISVPMPSCVFGMLKSASAFANVSGYLLSPLWCGSRGEPSIEASLRQDSIESAELLSLEASLPDPEIVNLTDLGENDPSVCPALRALAEEVLKSQHREACQNKTFLNGLNSQRCRAGRFPYPSLLIKAVSIPEPPLRQPTQDFLSTPTQLLALRRDQRERASDLSEVIKKFVFAVPKAGARPPVANTCVVYKDEVPESTLNEILLKPIEEFLEPFRESNARLSSFFPDKKLVQFDAGKLQTLAELLRERKRGGHKVLIFTQMSKMLDILEVFLNLNGHTYLRLDGGTSVDRRQRLMDRFNSDPKIFCFILSTRSGGVGVNLTGADTVVFYDSDWNPAMDLQAQDRAHRIGQTREVHIYRLITEHTVEENILLKAKQKRNLDIMVMDRGNFDASQAQTSGIEGESNQMKEIYTKGGLRAILGISPDDEDDEGGRSADEMDLEKGKETPLSSDQIEKTMTSLEDDDDVNALQGARKEAAEEFREFDETVEYKKDSDAEDDEDEKNDKEDVSKPGNSEDAKNADKELEREIAAWQEKGMDASVIVSSLSPMERYGLRFKKEIDPFYSVYAVMEYNRKMEAREVDNEIDIDEIERLKGDEERRAFDDGDLLGTGTEPGDLIRQRSLYLREKARVIGNKKRRKLTGEDWEQRRDALNNPFWYNIDTGEALWDKPRVLFEMEEYELAYRDGWRSIPMKNLVHIMEYLPSYPDKMKCATVSSRWHKAATDISFVRHVYPVELGSYTREERKIERNHYRTIADALVAASPGDTIELGDGHYWITGGLVVDFPVRLIGDEHNPSNVVVETSGTIVWRAGGGFIEGITFRRPKLSSGEASCEELLRIEGKGRLGMVQSVFDNDGSSGDVVKLTGEGLKGRWESCLFQNGVRGITLCEKSRLEITQCIISKNSDSAFVCRDDTELRIDACAVQKNQNHGVALHDKSRVTATRSRFLSNKGQVVKKESSGCSSTCSANICTKSVAVPVAPPGFQFNTNS